MLSELGQADPRLTAFLPRAQQVLVNTHTHGGKSCKRTAAAAVDTHQQQQQQQQRPGNANLIASPHVSRTRLYSYLVESFSPDAEDLQVRARRLSIARQKRALPVLLGVLQPLVVTDGAPKSDHQDVFRVYHEPCRGGLEALARGSAPCLLNLEAVVRCPGLQVLQGRFSHRMAEAPGDKLF